ncbi:MAG: hypothetical protein M0022_07315 [Desulfobacteraceae bacterium]|nr:hypothetical protein [Desulfobacteraceae bacterium]
MGAKPQDAAPAALLPSAVSMQPIGERVAALAATDERPLPRSPFNYSEKEISLPLPPFHAGPS